MAANTNILLETGTNELEVVEFILNYKGKNDEIANQSFGVNVAKVREIIRMPKLTKMPNLPEVVYGVFNLRGSIIPALDLSKYLYDVENQSMDNKMIIAEFNKVKVGFIVKDVQRIHRISWSDIVAPETMTDLNSEKSSIVGLINQNDRHILMLDVEKIVADIDPGSAIDNSNPEKIFDQKPIVVTAEDSGTIRKMITERLKFAGFEIVSFNNGKEAWDFMADVSNKVHNGANLKSLVNLVITDIEMPMMDGYSLTKNIKTDKILANLPVVIFSSIISADVLHRGKSVGADAQLTKPQIGELLETVRTLMHHYQSI